MATLRKDAQLGVLDQRVRSSCPRDGDIRVFRSVENQRWHRKCVKLVNEVGVETTPPDLAPLPGPPSVSHPRFLRFLEDFIYQATGYSLGIVKHRLEAPLHHPATPAQDSPHELIEER